MNPPVVSLVELAKRYGRRVVALEGLTLDLPGGAVGLLGPNGAGKSTLLRLLLGLTRPSGGRARIAGSDPTTRAGRLAIRRAVGYMPEGDCLIPGMNAVELVGTLGRISGLGRRDAMTRAHEVLDYVQLEEARYRGLDEYSTGMKQRLKLAQALVHDPGLLLLDEPTNGLDPKGRRHMLELVHDLGHAQGKDVITCSHLLPDVERTCDDVVVLHRGRVLASGSIEELTRAEERWLAVEVEGEPEGFARGLAGAGLTYERPERPAYPAHPARPERPERIGGHDLAAESARFRVRCDAGGADEGGDEGEVGDRLFALARDAGAVVTALAPVRSSLEEAFLGALEEADRADGAGVSGESPVAAPGSSAP